METQEEMSRYFWSASTNCLPVVGKVTMSFPGPLRQFYKTAHPRPQAQARAALTVALGQAVEQLIVIGSFALKECCGWEGNAG